MRVLAHKNINLHSKSTPGGLIYFAAKQSQVVPMDVTEHPAFTILAESGVISVFQNGKKIKPSKVEVKPQPAVEQEAKPQLKLDLPPTDEELIGQDGEDGEDGEDEDEDQDQDQDQDEDEDEDEDPQGADTHTNDAK